MNRVSWPFGTTLAVTAWAIVACAPLPGRTVDPVAPALGVRPPGPMADSQAWIGRYEDSRGAGDLAVEMRLVGSEVEGTFQLRTGGEGVLTGTLAESSIRFKFESRGGTCPAILEGSGTFKEGTWTATYAGRDCQGQITGGRLSLTRR